MNSLNVINTVCVGSNDDTGTASAILTSNGNTASVSWTAPVYVSDSKDSNIVISVSANSTTYADVNGMTIESSSGSVYNISTGEFTAPRMAIYIIDYAINIVDDSSTYSQFLSAIVSVNRGSGFVIEML